MIVIISIPLFLGDRATGGSGVAAASTSGNFARLPGILAAANPACAETATHANILAAAAANATTVLVVAPTAWTARAVGAQPTAARAT
jgi:2-keto-3-deoxygluconate permease